ncbi:MAG: hypothetical protein J7L07_05460 [Candidatus Odinarchaeota archaeon]|nr:hypothetical protein [Candidatus Odinarchaeota archaeon]
MKFKVSERQAIVIGYAITICLIIGIIYFIMVIIGIYLNAFGIHLEPFYTASQLFLNFDRWLKRIGVSLFLFFVFFILTLIAPVIIFYNEVLREKVEEIAKEIEEEEEENEREK